MAIRDACPRTPTSGERGPRSAGPAGPKPTLKSGSGLRAGWPAIMVPPRWRIQKQMIKHRRTCEAFERMSLGPSRDLQHGLRRQTLAPDKAHSLRRAPSRSGWRRWRRDAFHALASSLSTSRRAAFSFARPGATGKVSRWLSTGPIAGTPVLRRPGFPSRNAGTICSCSRNESARSSPQPARPAAATRRLHRPRKVLPASMTSPTGSETPGIGWDQRL